jgi:hypothetical protein
MLLIISFEKSLHEKDVHESTLVYSNSWGEFYVKRFKSTRKMLSFLRKAPIAAGQPEPELYIQRQSTSYHKIIERTKRLISTLPWAAHPGDDAD